MARDPLDPRLPKTERPPYRPRDLVIVNPKKLDDLAERLRQEREQGGEDAEKGKSPKR